MLNTRARVTRASLVVGLLVGAAGSADGAWNVLQLGAGSPISFAVGANGVNQFGTRLNNSNVPSAGRWAWTAGSWVSFNPAGAGRSTMLSALPSGAQQAGVAEIGGALNAGIWSGSAASWVNLHPASTSNSQATSTDGVQQVGYTSTVGDWASQRAALWNSTAGSWTDLTPSWTAQYSRANGVHAGRQVGIGTLPGQFGATNRAVLWSGTAASAVDLTPAIAVSGGALGIWGSQQVGYVSFSNQTAASLWNDTAASWVNLQPSGVTESYATATNGVFQVGYTSVGGVTHASLWNGTAASWEDLSLSLSNSSLSSVANAVWSDGVTLYVSGSYNNQAVVWSRPVPAPACVGMFAVLGVVSTRRRRGGLSN
jgi:hypothetical protein